MRHRNAGVKLNRTSSHRDAMFRNMVTSLLKHQRIKTTDVKAKELRRWVDHVITLAKRGDLHARRQVLAIVREKDVVHKLFDEAEKRFGNINGGYTRMVKIGSRPGDAAPISLIELVSIEEQPKKKKSKAAGKKKAAQAETAPAQAESKKPEVTGEEAAVQAQGTVSESDEQTEIDAKAGAGETQDAAEQPTRDDEGKAAAMDEDGKEPK